MRAVVAEELEHLREAKQNFQTRMESKDKEIESLKYLLQEKESELKTFKESIEGQEKVISEIENKKKEIEKEKLEKEKELKEIKEKFEKHDQEKFRMQSDNDSFSKTIEEERKNWELQRIKEKKQFDSELEALRLERQKLEKEVNDIKKFLNVGTLDELIALWEGRKQKEFRLKTKLKDWRNKYKQLDETRKKDVEDNEAQIRAMDTYIQSLTDQPEKGFVGDQLQNWEQKWAHLPKWANSLKHLGTLYDSKISKQKMLEQEQEKKKKNTEKNSRI